MSRCTVKYAVNSGDYYEYELWINKILAYIGMGSRDRIYSHMKDVCKGIIPHENKKLHNFYKSIFLL